MSVREIKLDAIDFADERYRMSYFRDQAALRRSIAAVGLLNPPLLWQASDDAPYTILCGYRRLLACRDLQYASVPARQSRAGELPALAAFRMNLFDNLTVRVLNPIEKAKILERLRRHFQLPSDQIVLSYHRLLDLPPQRAVLEDSLRLLTLPAAMQEALVQDRLSLSSAFRLARWAEADAAALFRLITELRLGVNRQRELLDWVEEIALGLGWSPARVVAEPSVALPALTGHKPPAERAEQVRHALRALRFPHWARQEALFRSGLSALSLAPGMRLIYDPLFEDPHLKIEFAFASEAELHAGAQTLSQLAENPALRNLLDLL